VSVTHGSCHMIAIPIAVPVSAKRLFAGLKRYADLIKDLATGGAELRGKIEVSKARTDLLHSSRASVERLERLVRVLNELKFQPHGIKGAVERLLKDPSFENRDLLEEQLRPAAKLLRRALRDVENNMHFEARFPNQMMLVRNVVHEKLTLIGFLTDEAAFNRDIVRLAKVPADDREAIWQDLKDRFEATNKAIDEAQKPLPAYVREQDEKLGRPRRKAEEQTKGSKRPKEQK